MNLAEIVKKTEEHAVNINLEDVIENFNFHKNIKDYMRTAPYYKNICSYINLYQIKRVLEIGTCSGASSACFAKYANYVETYDIVETDINDLAIFCDKLIFKKLEGPEDCLNINVNDFDMIFVDIDHSGVMEPKLHQKFVNDGYKGLVFWDDIILNKGMLDFWRGIQQEKEMLSWHHSGFGVVLHE